jgi:hypothetical protein
MAVVVRIAFALDLKIFAHIYTPGFIRVARKQAVGADLERRAMNESVM